MRWYAESRFFGLHVSPTTTVVRGRNGWLFYADAVRKEHADVVIQEIVGRHLYSFWPSPELVPR